MTKSIRFQKKQQFYILTDFKEGVLKKIADELLQLHIDTGRNKFNFHTIKDFISLESFKDETLEKIKRFSFYVEFIDMQIDTDKHKSDSIITMYKKPLESFKAIYLNVVLTSKVYKIEKYVEENILKLEGLKDNINLNDVYFKYEIT